MVYWAFMLKRTFFPEYSQNRMSNEGDILNARRHYLQNRPRNLYYLLKNRFEWMNDYVEGKEKVFEIGAGAGFSKEFIKNENLVLTDYNSPHDWISFNVDALNQPFESNSVDVIIASHMIHHLANPQKFFMEIGRVLKPGGLLLIQDLNTSLLLRILLRVMRHEGYSYDIDVFDKNVVANNPEDPWSANCAIPELLFKEHKVFESHFPEFKIVEDNLFECLMFPLSGGVIAKTKTPTLPAFVLRLVEKIDAFLITLAPSIFAMGRKIVLEKK